MYFTYVRFKDYLWNYIRFIYKYQKPTLGGLPIPTLKHLELIHNEEINYIGST
jgi:hypothetical protein